MTCFIETGCLRINLSRLYNPVRQPYICGKKQQNGMQQKYVDIKILTLIPNILLGMAYCIILEQ